MANGRRSGNKDFDRAIATLYTIAQIADVGSQLLGRSVHARVRGLPSNLTEYVADLYGHRDDDGLVWYGWGFVLLSALLVVTIVGRVGGWW